MSNDHLFRQDELSYQIEKYDHVKIVGKDEYKGYIGHVTGIYKNPTLEEPLYIIELQATGSIIQRPKIKLKPIFKMQQRKSI